MRQLSLTLVFTLGFLGCLLAQEEMKTDQDVLGYAYNLYAVKAQKIEKNKNFGDCKIPGGVLLDPRKSYTLSYSKDEYFSDNARSYKEDEVYQFPGYFRMSRIFKPDIEEYYIATKIANQWTNHAYEEIMAYEEERIGQDIGCENCNFWQYYFNDDANCVVTVYYQILPLRDKNELEFQESITGTFEGKEQEVKPAMTQVVNHYTETKPKKQKSRLVDYSTSVKKTKVADNNSGKKNSSNSNKMTTAVKRKTAMPPRPPRKQTKNTSSSTTTTTKATATSNAAVTRNVSKYRLSSRISDRTGPDCMDCHKSRKEIISMPNNNFCDALARDKAWISFYNCKIACYDADGVDKDDIGYRKVVADLDRSTRNAAIRSKRCQ